MTFLALTIASALYYAGSAVAFHPATSPADLEKDAREYYWISSDLLHVEYHFDPRRTPFYPLVLTLFRVFAGDRIVATQLVGAAFFGMCAPLTYRLVRSVLHNEGVALTAAIFMIVWPPYAAYAGKLYSEAAALPFFLLMLLILPRGSLLYSARNPMLARSAGAGVALAWCMLLRPMYLLFYPFAIVILFLEESDRKLAATRCLLLTLGCLVLVGSWSCFSSLQSGEPILISANGGETISGGLNQPLLTEGYRIVSERSGRITWTGPGKWLDPYKSGYLSPKELQLPYLRIDRILRQRTWQWVMRNAGGALYLQDMKLLYMWGLYPLSIDMRQTFLGNVPTLAFLLLDLIALLRFRARLRQLARFWTLPLFVSLVALISWGSWRFRQPGDVGLLVLGTMTIWSFLIPSTEVFGCRDQDPLPPDAAALENKLRELTVN